MSQMMACGHAAQGVDGKGDPVCVICAGSTENARIPALDPLPEGRTARCSYYGGKCHSEAKSSPDLAFFVSVPAKEHDGFYCGCYGWD